MNKKLSLIMVLFVVFSLVFTSGCINDDTPKEKDVEKEINQQNTNGWGEIYECNDRACIKKDKNK